MNYEEKVEFLKGYRYAVLTIKGLEAEKQRWRDYGVDIAQKYNDMPIAQGGSEGRVSKSATGVVGIEEKRAEELNKAFEERDKVCSAIDGLKNRRYRIILYLHYVSMMPFRAIARELDKSERNVIEVHKKAVKELEI